MVHVHHQVHEERAGAGDFLAALVRLQRDLGDLPLGFLRAGVQRRREAGGGLGILPSIADELALALRAFRQVHGGGGNRLRRGLQLPRGGCQAARHGGERIPLVPDLAQDLGDRRGRPVHAHAQETELVGGASGTACSAFHPAGQVAALDLTEHAARGLQALDDLHERRYERDAGEHQHQALLDVERPAPAAPHDLGQCGDERERHQVDDQRSPRFAPLEVQRGLERSDHVRAIEDVTVGTHRQQHGRNEQAADGEIELRVPRLELGSLHKPAHARVGAREARRENKNEPPGDRREPCELDGREQHDAEPHEAPARPRVRQHIVPLLRQSLLDELIFEAGHRRKR